MEILPNRTFKIGDQIFSPPAHAFTPGGAAVLFAITVGASVVVVNAPFYIGREIYESMKEGHVECNGRVFSVRKKGRTAFGKAKGSYHVIDPDIITQIFGKPQHCNPETIAELKRRSDPLKLTKQDEKSHSPTKVD